MTTELNGLVKALRMDQGPPGPQHALSTCFKIPEIVATLTEERTPPEKSMGFSF